MLFLFPSILPLRFVILLTFILFPSCTRICFIHLAQADNAETAVQEGVNPGFICTKGLQRTEEIPLFSASSVHRQEQTNGGTQHRICRWKEVEELS